jgi:hypothetical protein
MTWSWADMAVYKLRWTDLAVMASVLVLAAGCTATKKATAEAVSATSMFHSRFNREEFRGIYETADQAFRKMGTEEQMEAFLVSQHRQLGDFQTADAPSYSVNFMTKETIVTLTYRSTFTNGHAQEQFIWVVIDGTTKLRKYWLTNIELGLCLANIPPPRESNVRFTSGTKDGPGAAMVTT